MAVTIRANDVKASNLLLVSLVLAIAAQAVQLMPAFSSRFLGTLLYLVFDLLPGLALVWLIRQGHHWAKVFFLFLVVVGLFFYLPKLAGQKEPMNLLLVLAGAVPQVWAVLLIVRDLLRKPAAPAAGEVGGGYDRPN